MNYKEKLKDPRWQKKRLEIMQRDNFQCQRCLSGKDTLAVHHKEYIKGRNPWEYKNNTLVTLCDDCHKFLHDYVEKMESPKYFCEALTITTTDWYILNSRLCLLQNKYNDEWINKLIELITNHTS